MLEEKYSGEGAANGIAVLFFRFFLGEVWFEMNTAMCKDIRLGIDYVSNSLVFC